MGLRRLGWAGEADSLTGMTDRKAKTRRGVALVVSDPSRVREGYGGGYTWPLLLSRLS